MYEMLENQKDSWSQPRSESGLAIQSLIAQLCRVPLDDLLGKGGGARVRFARQTAMYLMHVLYGLSLAEVGASFGRDRGAASQACHRIEDLRDDPCFDHQLTQLERLLQRTAAAGTRDTGGVAL